MIHPTDRTTGKMILEGDPYWVDAITEALRQPNSGIPFAVTYVGKDQSIKLTGHVRRTLRLKKNQ
jgi:hypothetical protein